MKTKNKLTVQSIKEKLLSRLNGLNYFYNDVVKEIEENIQKNLLSENKELFDRLCRYRIEYLEIYQLIWDIFEDDPDKLLRELSNEQVH